MFNVPDGAELFNVDGVPVFKLADGSTVFAEDGKSPFPRASWFAKGSKATADDLAYWAHEAARRESPRATA